MFVYIPRATAELVQLSPIGEDDQSNLSIAKNREFICFFQQPIPSLSKGDLPIDLVLYSLQLNPTPSHSLFNKPLSKFLFFSQLTPILICIFYIYTHTHIHAGIDTLPICIYSLRYILLHKGSPCDVLFLFLIFSTWKLIRQVVRGMIRWRKGVW